MLNLAWGEVCWPSWNFFIRA